MTEPLDVLAVMAHPDDAELLAGGVLSKMARAGRRVGILDLTAGEMGSSGTPEKRAEEATEAARVLGVGERRCAFLPDSALENDNESRHVVAEHLRALRPRVVVTHWKVGRHRDHRIASELVRDASFLSGLRKLDVAGEPFRPEKLVYATAYREDVMRPDFVVEIPEEDLERKLDALAAYGSQFAGVSALGEVFPGGQRPILEQIRAQMAHYGSLIRAAYGEPFMVDEVLRLSDLTALDVPTF
jgi:bacillithiol biosynthesis deacetylase BshB1